MSLNASGDFVAKLKVSKHLNLDPYDPIKRKRYNDFSTRKLFENHPEAALQKYDFHLMRDVHPLLMLCCFAPSKDTVEQVYTCNPSAIQEVDSKFGWTPMFASLKFSGTRPETIMFLARMFPRALSSPAQDGWTPLHLACAKEVPIELIKLMVKLAPEALAMTNRLDWTPLHLAVGYCAPLEVVRLLAARYPKALTAKNNMGQTPLQQAADKPHVLALLKRIEASSYPTIDVPMTTGTSDGNQCVSQAKKTELSATRRVVLA